MRIGVVGGGVVGRATARVFLEHVDEVRVWDVVKERRTVADLDLVLGCNLVFVCLPEDVLDQFFATPFPYRDVNWVLKSTVPIGTTRRLAEKYDLPQIVHSPEFLTARCAMTDVQVPARNIIGVLEHKRKVLDTDVGLILHGLYKRRFPGVDTLVMTCEESEAVKLFTNGFFATKVAYFNEIRALADKLGLDWETVRAGMLSDGRIAHSHTQVPGPDGKRGFGGRCLVKDAEQLCREFSQLNDAATMTRAALIRNEIDRQEP